MNRAVFAVVGHPNKGKSSIVSTLARNDSVKVSQRSGTTTAADVVRVETAHSGYELVDTPGFQRPNKVLAWLNQHSVQADQRAKAVETFINDVECQKRFPDEVALLTPLIKGAAILYVVDGSRPFGVEYEAEMEILRWTGQPSMALINPIENHEYVDSWSDALAQYFKTVRIFNPMKADFERQLELLQAFAHLKPEWAKTLRQVNQDLINFREQQRKNSAIILARLLEDLCVYQISRKVLNKKQAESIQPLLVEEFSYWMRQREQRSIEELFAVYAHYQTELTMENLNMPPDLFDCDQWYMWGLNKKQLATVGAITGAAAGAAADMAVAGHSFMLGAIGGGLLGFGSAWFGADKLVTVKLQGLPLGGFEAVYGPINNKNFPYVVIGRFVHLHQQISQRNHAQRGVMQVTTIDLQQQITSLERSTQKALHQSCARLIKQKTVDDLETLILPLLK
ncbi:DUF3482 domain-containing protein [Aliikangiella sp. IMCC44359]|uniref:DUF3482 domain-containing protein n=1 Tax=Aliikangiella sp. IMCC44359 TaxID=3459125 RepID=UPI00403AF098